MRKRSRGFTLVELSIVIGMIAILASVVLIARGFRKQAQVGSSVQMVRSLQKAAQAYAERYNNGISFNGINALADLEGEFLITGFTSPYDRVPVVNVDGADPTRVEIAFDANTNEEASDIVASMATMCEGTTQAGLWVTTYCR